jgi:hypothetical protein
LENKIRIMVTRKTEAKLGMGISLFVGVFFAYFMWLTWNKLTVLIGDNNVVWGVTGVIVLLAIAAGAFGIDRIAKNFL